ncbi:hypothetical protein DL991_32435 [Amycolatopsis sp. WAC 01375]|uniref:tyrosine-type recombinase/integrase n=1 Tax=Amycolatopsis sp. WAC 01375 TaxID=2203194 RepID=UPI000F7A7DC6|nr:tyrosine-type recombinase/integrase [Amycolatopsis sp. WAC 01375]RSM72910.1 hypothetical protein DL991_32435 [Amycolatopsis sp. WAC 01375]
MIYTTRTRPNRHTPKARLLRTPGRGRHCSNATRTRPHTTIAETSHSYVTHLVEFGYPPRFVQEQVGHAYPSTTSIYTDVSDEYRNRLMHQALGAFAPFMWEAP